MRRTLPWVVGALVFLAAAVVLLLPDRRPNVLWISIDGLRADRLPAYGYHSGATPLIDDLARRGSVFEQVFADAPWTTASMASALTGRFSARHGLRTPFRALADEELTVAEILAQRGYQTAAVVGAFPVDAVHGLNQGFAHYDDRYDSAIDGEGGRAYLPSEFHAGDVDRQRTYRIRKLRRDSYRADASVGDAAVGWLRRASRMRPFFLWVHFFGPQRRAERGATPVRVRDDFVAAHDQRVSELDAEIGRILNEVRARGELDRTIVVLHAAAGDDLSPHRPTELGRRLSDPVLRVPLVIAWPGGLPAGRVNSQVRVVDIAPTVLELLGVAPAVDLDGRSLRPLMDGEEREDRLVLAETLLSAEADLNFFRPDGSAAVPGVWRRAARTPRWKYIASEPIPFVNFSRPPPLPPDAARHRREQLYDLEADPGETRNVIALHPNVAATLRDHLRMLPSWPDGGANGG
jgi:arylsulfatase A-like enzyme